MNSLDIILVCFIAYHTIRGLFKGLINELFSLLAIIGGLCFVYFFGDVVNAAITSLFKIDHKFDNLLLAAQFVLLALSITYVGKLATSTSRFLALGTLNRGLGGLFGFVKSLLIVYACFYLYSNLIEIQPSLDQEIVKQSIVISKLKLLEIPF